MVVATITNDIFNMVSIFELSPLSANTMISP
jgi:formate hydrogenlyase subunit 3/multisubunit Na+/H+ antiporter MnhD subunit